MYTEPIGPLPLITKAYLKPVFIPDPTEMAKYGSTSRWPPGMQNDL